MKYQILIVDDESVDLEWMKRRIQSSGRRLEVVAAVNSASAALEIVKNKQIDVILSDICMPMMSGMDMIRQVKQLNSHSRVMFISGHKEFEYAKQAVDFNAFCYLLKPVEDEELWEKLDAVIADLDKEQNQHAESLKLQATFSLVREEMLFRWLEGDHMELGTSTEIDLGADVQTHGMAAAVVEVDQLDWRIDRANSVDWQTLHSKIFEFVAQYVKERGWGYNIQGERQRKTLLLLGNELTQLARTNELIDAVGNIFPLTISIGLGFHTKDEQELPLSYQAAKKALGSKWHAGKNKTLISDDGVGEMNNLILDSDEEWATIIHALEEYNLTEIDDWIETLFKRFQFVNSKNTVLQHLVHTIIKLNEQFHTLNENFDEIMEWKNSIPNDLLECETVLDMKSWLRRQFFAFSEKWMLKKQKYKRKLIIEIMEYMEEQADPKITLKKIADHFGFSANYLGLLFKQEMGQHFNSFVTEQRIRKACLLLQNPKFKIYEISENIGYKNSIYFNRQFNQVMGMSPAVYRKRMKI